jgi:hypothetical protein
MRTLSSNVVKLSLAAALGAMLGLTAAFALNPLSTVNPTTKLVLAFDFALHHVGVSPEQPNHSAISSPIPTGLSRIAANIDQCTNSDNYCVQSCATQQAQCSAKNNNSNYCQASYNTCSVSCRNHLNSCLK